ncbi:MAG: M48 family metalloprotease [Blastocatellia bacterium]|nr:M48 family metalloprotease [Blastocatellia bacterium]
MTKFIMTICLGIFTLHTTLALPRTWHEKKEAHQFNAAVLATFARADDFFQSDWERDTARLEELIAYLRQNERYTGQFDCHCKSYAYLGKNKGEQLSAARRTLIQRVLQVHDANVQVCILEMYDGTPAMSYLGGDVFLNWKTINKLTEAELVALLGHEIGHRYAHRAIQTDQEEEIFADYVAAWTLQQMGLESSAAITLFNRLPSRKGGSTHPSHKERQRRLSQLAHGWEISRQQRAFLTEGKS